MVEERSIPTLDVLVTGGTGYIGVRLVDVLVRRGHRVRLLTRAESAGHVVAGATAVVGDVFVSVAQPAPVMQPAWRDGARRLGLVTLRQMVAALVDAAEHPPQHGEVRVVDVTGIRRAAIMGAQ